MQSMFNSSHFCCPLKGPGRSSKSEELVLGNAFGNLVGLCTRAITYNCQASWSLALTDKADVEPNNIFTRYNRGNVIVRDQKNARKTKMLAELFDRANK